MCSQSHSIHRMVQAKPFLPLQLHMGSWYEWLYFIRCRYLWHSNASFFTILGYLHYSYWLRRLRKFCYLWEHHCKNVSLWYFRIRSWRLFDNMVPLSNWLSIHIDHSFFQIKRFYHKYSYNGDLNLWFNICCLKKCLHQYNCYLFDLVQPSVFSKSCSLKS